MRTQYVPHPAMSSISSQLLTSKTKKRAVYTSTESISKSQRGRSQHAKSKGRKSFTEFQNFAIESGRLPLDVTLELSRTAMGIVNHVNEARTVRSNGREQGNIAKSTNSTRDTSNERNGNQKNNEEIDEQIEHYIPMQVSAMSKEASSDRQDPNISITSKRSHPPTYGQAGSFIT
jgi:hypothetical protein